jgi:predicted metal-dependent hydrolase
LRIAPLDITPLGIEPLQANALRKEGVTLAGGTVTVWCKATTNDDRIALLLEQWSRAQAEAYFTQRMAALLPHFDAYAVRPPTLKVRKMRARWGSCSTNGTITLNVKLIHLEPALIDYVIMHELCHMIEHNHSKRYYTLLAQMMPDWKARRQRLNETGMPE